MARRLWTAWSLAAALILLLPLWPLLSHLSTAMLGYALIHGRNAIVRSVFVSLGVLGVAFLALTPLAYQIGRQEGRLWRWLTFLLSIPLLMPPLVLGLLLIFLFGPSGLFGGLLQNLGLSGSNSLLALFLAEFFESAPYYLFAARGAFAQVDRTLEEEGMLLGLSPVRVFWRVTLWEALPGLLSGMTMAWARAVGAFGAVVIIAYHPYALPMQLWLGLQEYGLFPALAYAFWLLIIGLPLPLWFFARGGRYGSR